MSDKKGDKKQPSEEAAQTGSAASTGKSQATSVHGSLINAGGGGSHCVSRVQANLPVNNVRYLCAVA